MIDYIHERCKTWGAQQRWILLGKDGWPSRSMLGRIMDEGLLGASAGAYMQSATEVLSKDALELNNAIKTLSEQHRVSLFIHYVIHGKGKIKAARMSLSKSVYYERIDCAHGELARALYMLTGQNRPKQSGTFVGQKPTVPMKLAEPWENSVPHLVTP